MLGRSLRPPPEAVAPLAADLHPDLTTRERVDAADQARRRARRATAMINPLGLHPGALRRRRPIPRARRRASRSTRPGTYQTRDRRDGDVRRAPASWPTFLAGSEETHDAFVEQLFHHLVKQPIRAFGPTTLADLRRSFVENGFNIRKLMVEIMADVGLDAAAS